VPKKRTVTEPEAIALIIREATYRIGCEDFTPPFSLHRSEPDAPGRYPRANWDAMPEDPEHWPPDCAQAFREAVKRNRASTTLIGRHHDDPAVLLFL